MWHVNILLFFFLKFYANSASPKPAHKNTLEVEGKSGTQHKGRKLNHS